MILLDENIIDDQRQLLKKRRLSIHQIGYEIGRQGLKDDEIIPFLLQLKHPVFFTRDRDFYHRSLCHSRYCLVHLAVLKTEVANFIFRFLRHPKFDTMAKRMGAVIQVSHVGLSVWHLHAEKEVFFDWPRFKK